MNDPLQIELFSLLAKNLQEVSNDEINKGLSAEDIKFYGKIHFNRDRSENSTVILLSVEKTKAIK